MGTQLDVRKQRELAYRLWEERGRPEGRAEEDWFEAERRLRSAQHQAESAAVDEAARESFPASDPPSTHVAGQAARQREEAQGLGAAAAAARDHASN